jgi:hypothetical protein
MIFRRQIMLRISLEHLDRMDYWNTLHFIQKKANLEYLETKDKINKILHLECLQTKDLSD